MSDYTKAIAEETDAVAKIKQMARDNADALHMIWGWGDGSGGGVIDMIAKEIGRRSPRDQILRDPNLKVKKIISGSLRTRVFERDAYRCVKCANHIDLTVDHIKPESKGGTLDFDNLQTLCRSCNCTKGDRE